MMGKIFRKKLIKKINDSSQRIKPVLICGIQPTESLTIGNYIGSLLPLIQHQEEFDSILLIADLHAYTIPLSTQKISLETIKKRSWELAKWAVATGVGPKTKIIFQSDLKAEHLELFYFLLTHSRLGELKIMTQYKFLMQQFREPNGTEPDLFGVLVYPVLMAADVLLYDASYLSVGEDQTQHLELCSTLSSRLNKAYRKPLFPNTIKTLIKNDSSKIMDLQEPEKKMSKSSKNKSGVLFFTDTKEEIEQKIMKAKTDSFNEIKLDKNSQPGIHNLLTLHSTLSGHDLEISFKNFKNSSYKELKESIAKLVSKTIGHFQERYSEINERELKKRMEQDAQELKKRAQTKLKFIYSEIQKFAT